MHRWRRYGIALRLGAVFLVGCTEDQRDYSDGRDVKNAALGIIGRHPENPEAQTAAIEETNALVGMQTVLFHIPGEIDLTITPQSPLPAISGPLELNAQTQPGFNGSPIVVVDGAGAGATPGLTLSGGGVGIQGLVIEGCFR